LFKHLKRCRVRRLIPVSSSLDATPLWRAETLAPLEGLLMPTESARVVIDLDLPGPTISRHLYGHFAEHLGRCIYGGFWVGEDSDIPNTRGYRNDVLEALRALQVPLMRWPGGWFADEYNWRDGIGPRDQRPVKVNTHWGGVEEDNAFGTHEFLDLAEMIGAQVYVNGNLGTGSPREMAEWVEYMTSDTNSTLANLRRANGREEPWDVHYFAVGNEAWGCGGHMRPEYYADLYRHWATFIKAPPGKRPKLIASGGHGEDTTWTEVLTSQIQRDMDAISFHYYTLPTGDWQKKGASTGFGEDEWISTLANTLRVDGFIRNNLKVMDKHDPEKRIGFYVDEWGTWYDPAPGREPGFLYQQNTLRDAVAAAVNFNIFHNYAERVRMTNIAQMINVLQAMILTERERMVLTPTYHVFQMYIPFQGATHLPVQHKRVPDYRLDKVRVPGVSASAARGTDGRIYLAVVNLNPNTAAQVSIELQGARANGASGRLLTSETMDAHNTFDAPQTIQPVSFSGKVQGGRLQLELPAKSIAVVGID
jgi:alpha-N-arabinofuranosidase